MRLVELIIKDSSKFIDIDSVYMISVDRFFDFEENRYSTNIVISFDEECVFYTHRDMTIDYACDVIKDFYSQIKDKDKNLYMGEHELEDGIFIPFVLNTANIKHIAFHPNLDYSPHGNRDITTQNVIKFNKKYIYSDLFVTRDEYFRLYNFYVKLEYN